MALVVVEIEPQLLLLHMAVALHYVYPYDVVFAGGYSGALGDIYGDAFANG